MQETSPDIAFTIILVTLLILLLVAGIAIAFFQVNKQKINQQIERKESQLNYEKELRQVEVEVGENLMQQISRELHDHIGHEITCLRLALENHKLDFPEHQSTLNVLNSHVTSASQQIRLLSRSLNREYISNLSLDKSLELEIERLKELDKFEIHWDNDYEPNWIDKNQELVAFRIFQEVINNSIKHSEATIVDVSLKSQPHFHLKVRDNGVGFELENMLSSIKASGLKNIIKRAEMAHFSCSIETSIDKGCTYIIRQNTISAHG